MDNYREAAARLQEKIESWLETLEILADEEYMASLRRGIEDSEAGRTIPWEDVKKELGFE